jgi:hypothetical protein
MEDDPVTVRRMISYLYTLDYDDEIHITEITAGNTASPDTLGGETVPTTSTNSQPEEKPSLCSAVRMYEIAEKYDLPDLKKFSSSRFKTWVELGGWSHKDFPAIIRDIFESTPDGDNGLRDTVCREFKIHSSELLERGDEFLGEIKDISEFWFGVAQLALFDIERLDGDLLHLHSAEQAIENAKECRCICSACRRGFETYYQKQGATHTSL